MSSRRTARRPTLAARPCLLPFGLARSHRGARTPLPPAGERFGGRSYVGKGVEGLIKEGGTKRREAAEKAMASAGGRLESFYYAFGEDDVIGVCDLPDVPSAVAVSLIINATGVVNLKLTPLITPEEVDAASKKHPNYRAPGQ